MIFELGGDTALISNKQIVAGLSVSAASVSEMITKLVEQKYVTHTPYQGIKLTASGQRRAAALVRNHRLWEVFLTADLGYPVDNVHSEAEMLEHAMTPEMAERMAKFLGNPKYCPHGGVIPDEDGHYLDQSRATLSQVDVGAQGHIERIVDEASLIDYVFGLGLAIEDHFEVIEKTPSAIRIRQRETGKELAIDPVRAEHIFVEL